MDEPFYPIGTVAKLTGMQRATIDAWERRHGAVKPKHGARGRLYSEQEVQRLMLLRDAVARGHSIGQIGATRATKSCGGWRQMPSPMVFESEESFEAAAQAGTVLAPLLEAIEAYDYGGAERELNRVAAATADPQDTVYEIALPLMRTTGERWHEGRFTIAQEHMVTALLTGLLASMLRVYGNPNPVAKVLMATPENEHHGFGVLAAAMLTAAKGLGALHLGTNLPSREIVHAARRTHANAVLLGVCGADTARVLVAMQEIRKGIEKRIHLWVGGVGDDRLANAAGECGWQVMKNFHELEHQLDVVAAEN